MDLPAPPSSPCRPGLLTSNEPPLDAELPSLRDFISREQSILDTLNAHIDQFLTRRDASSERLQQYVAVLSPARRVPADLWREIFSLVPFTGKVRDREIHCPPWRLGHICRLWREVAISSPLLWNTLEIVRPTSTTYLPDTHPISMIECQLLRSSNALLEVTLDVWHGDETEAALLDALMSHSHRWRTFNARVMDVNTDILFRLKNVRGRISELREFDLFIDLKDYDGEQEEDCDFLSIAPSLREVSLTDDELSSLSPRFNLPWAQITHYEGKFSKDIQLDILSAACDLIECCLAFLDDSPSSPDVGRTVTLPHLRRLRVEATDFLHHLTAPSLQQLRLTLELDPLLPFVQRSECNLTKLVITHCWWNDLDILPSVLQASPNLETLIYIPDDPEESTPIWRSMTISDPKFDLCPRLKFMAWAWGGEVALEPFLDMIESRTTSGARVVVRFLSEREDEERRTGRNLPVLDNPDVDIGILSVQETQDLFEEW